MRLFLWVIPTRRSTCISETIVNRTIQIRHIDEGAALLVCCVLLNLRSQFTYQRRTNRHLCLKFSQNILYVEKKNPGSFQKMTLDIFLFKKKYVRKSATQQTVIQVPAVSLLVHEKWLKSYSGSLLYFII